MSQVTTCRVEDCDREAKRKAAQLCDAHYQQERRGVPFTKPRTPRGEGGKAPCDFPECGKPKRAQGYCHGHYQQYKQGQELRPLLAVAKSVPGAICVVGGCQREVEVNVHQVCRPHYKRLKRHGDPIAGGTRRTRNADAKEFLLFHGWDEVQRVDGLSPCWEWRGARSKQGYGRADDKYIGSSLVHRLSYTVWNGPLGEDEFACHRCDNPPCMNPAHLFAGSRQDNVDDMISKERHAHGVKVPNHILTPEQVVEIRAKYIPYKYSQQRLADEYGVARTTIEQVTLGSTWKLV